MACKRLLISLAASCSALSITSVSAQGPQEATLEEAFAACSAIKSKTSRLECFDSLANAVDDAAPDNIEAPAVPPAPSRATIAPKPQPPAESVPAPIAPAPPQPSEAIEPVLPAEDDKKFLIIPKEDPRAQAVRPSPFTATITKVILRNNKLYIRLDNGETWKQTSRSRPRLPKEGMSVEFTRGIAGGWFAKFGNRGGKTSMTLVD